MPTLADLYEEHARDCLRAAEQTDNDPAKRLMLLKLAHAWERDALVLRANEAPTPATPEPATPPDIKKWRAS
jgi:hypothetical protein